MESVDLTESLGAVEAEREDSERSGRMRRLLILLLLLLLLLFGLVFAFLILNGTDFRPDPGRPIKVLFSVYGFDRPLGVSTDDEGKIYISDTGRSRFVALDDFGDYEDMIFSTKTKDKFFGVMGSYVDNKTGRSYIADFRRRTINVYSPQGKRLARWPKNPLDESFGPLGFSPFALVEHDNKLYITSTDGVYVFSKKGKLLKSWTGRGRDLDEFDYPVGIAVDKDGSMYVADQLNRRVIAMTPEGNVKWVLGTPDKQGKLASFFGLPRGIAVNDEGRIFVSDTFHHEIVVLEKSGKLVGSLGERGVEDGQLNFPEAIAFRPDGALYIADRENDRIQAWRINKINRPAPGRVESHEQHFTKTKG